MKHIVSPFTDTANTILRRISGGNPARPGPQSRLFGMTGRRRDTPFSTALLDQIGLPLVAEPDELSRSQGLIATGRNYLRQDRLDLLAEAIREHDTARATTASGTPLAELLAAGARSDLSRALYSASDAGALVAGSRVFEGLSLLDEAARDHKDDPICVSLLALTYMDAGWAWYRQGWQRGSPKTYLPQFQDAFGTAARLLAPICALEHDSPLVASTRCALLAGLADAEERVVDDFEDLIDLAPTMPGHMRAFGLHLLPCWFGSYHKLEIEARRTAARTEDVWGAGGYTWVYLDAALLDGACFAFLDTELFLEGIDDILTRRGTEHIANMLAAYLSRMLARTSGDGPDRPQRRALQERRDRILRGDMHEVHPWVWALMDSGYATPGNTAEAGEEELEIGTQQAWDAIRSVFSKELTQRA